ncbi:MAG: endonuclease Q family protein [Candidatus Anstonellales archaeon]
MDLTIDLHIHGKYSRATSSKLEPYILARTAERKGINVLGTGDFTHPKWLEMFTGLEQEDGLLTMGDIKFMLSVEVNNVFEYNSKTLTIHNVILTDSIESAKQIADALSKYGDIEADGRPTLNISMLEMMDLLKSLNPKTEVFAAHIWTPWFSILGARNGLNSIYEVIDRRLLAVETGLSADPEMTWSTHAGDFPIISNSDAHSPDNLGREATVIDVERITYNEIISSIKNRKIIKTYEFYPQEGKYYYDGHRNCGISLHPGESIQNMNICRKCGKKLTIGVLHRCMELRDNISRPRQKFIYIIPIRKVVSYATGLNENSKRVDDYVNRLISLYGNELSIYEKITREDMAEYGEIGERIYRIIKGDIEWQPGYDGVYGTFKLRDKKGLFEQLKH